MPAITLFAVRFIHACSRPKKQTIELHEKNDVSLGRLFSSKRFFQRKTEKKDTSARLLQKRN